jgi:rhomboid protease GluP
VAAPSDPTDAESSREEAPESSDEPASKSSAPSAPPPVEAEEARGFTGAPVSAALLATNVGVFAAQVYLSGDYRYVLGMPDGVLRWLGANASLWTISDNRLETLVTACFLHQSILHLGLNMAVLWFVGPLLERAIGSARFFPLYLASGIVASASSAIWGRFFHETVSCGASGALCGIVAAATVVGIRTEGWRGELTIGMGRWLALFVLIGLVRTFNPGISQIDNAAHIGGALGGAVVATAWERGYIYSRRAQQAITLAMAGLVLCAAGVVYVRNRTDPFLFMDVEGRINAFHDAIRRGDCGRARSALQRAMQMDPTNAFIRTRGGIDLDLECSDPASDRPSPRIRY